MNLFHHHSDFTLTKWFLNFTDLVLVFEATSFPSENYTFVYCKVFQELPCLYYWSKTVIQKTHNWSYSSAQHHEGHQEELKLTTTIRFSSDSETICLQDIGGLNNLDYRCQLCVCDICALYQRDWVPYMLSMDGICQIHHSTFIEWIPSGRNLQRFQKDLKYLDTMSKWRCS